MNCENQQTDMVNHPSHYTMGKIEVIDFIEDKKLGFHLGNAVKYIARAGKKESIGISIQQKEIQDLEKALWYIKRRISNLKEVTDDNDKLIRTAQSIEEYLDKKALGKNVYIDGYAE